MKVFKCTVCDWEGKEPVELAGYLWDYFGHKACPKCWSELAEDNMVVRVVKETPNESI